MTVTSGFFNSKNGDRKYDAEVMSSIFDGIINDGVFQSVGTAFAVKASSGNTINVGIGRCWFNSTWLLNDAVLPMTFAASDVLNPRWDAVIIEIDRSESVRAGSIKMVKGKAAASPSKPSITKGAYKNQYPLAYIYRKAGSTEITQADITNMIGTSSCPYVNGILEVQNIDKIVAQWQGQWEQWYKNTSTWTTNWNEWFKNTENWEAKWNQWFAIETGSTDADLDNYLLQSKVEIDKWFNDLRNNLDNDTAVALASKIADLQSKFDALASERSLYDTIEDSNGRSLVGSDGTEIIGKVVFDSDGATFVGESDGSNKAYFANLPASGWTGDATNGYSQIVTCSGMGAGTIVLPPMFKPTGNKDTDLALRTAISCISIVETLEDKIQVTCWEAKPSIDLDIVLLEGSGATGMDDIVIGPNTDTFFPDSMFMTSFGGKVAPVPMSRIENAIEEADTKAEEALTRVGKLEMHVKEERARALKAKAGKASSLTIYPDEGSNLRVTAHGFTNQNGSGDPSPPLKVDDTFVFKRISGSANSYATSYIITEAGAFTVTGLSKGGTTNFNLNLSSESTQQSFDGKTLYFKEFKTLGTDITLTSSASFGGTTSAEMIVYLANSDFSTIVKGPSVTSSKLTETVKPDFKVAYIAVYFTATTTSGFNVSTTISLKSTANVAGNYREIVTGGQQANLLKQIPDASGTCNGVAWVVKNGVLSFSGTPNGPTLATFALKIPCDIPAGKYTAVVNQSVYGNWVQDYFDESQKQIIRLDKGNATKTYSFELERDAKYVTLQFYISGSNAGTYVSDSYVMATYKGLNSKTPAIPNQNGVEYGTVLTVSGTNQLIPLTAPLCEGDTVQTWVKSGCDKVIVLDGITNRVVDGGTYWFNYAASDVLAGATVYGDYVPANDMQAVLNYIQIRKTAVAQYGTTAEALNEYFASHPLTVWYRSTNYTEKNDTPVSLETHQQAVLVLDGTENWAWSNVSSTTRYRAALRGTGLKNGGNVLCSIAKQGTTAVTANTIEVAGGNLLMYLRDYGGQSDFSAFKSYLSSNPATVVAEHATPITYAHDPIYIEAAPNGDGNVTITGEANGQVSVEYNKSITRAFEELQALVVTLGGIADV